MPVKFSGTAPKILHVPLQLTWANKAEAMASYAKMAHDDTLRKMADRVQARAIRRCGELLRTFKSANGTRTDLRPHGGTVTRSQAAAKDGLSERQEVTALRVANVPEDDFEDRVGSEKPPSASRRRPTRHGRRPRRGLAGCKFTPRDSAAAAGELLNVSERTIKTARNVVRFGAPELVAAVERGAVSVSAAAVTSVRSNRVARRSGDRRVRPTPGSPSRTSPDRRCRERRSSGPAPVARASS